MATQIVYRIINSRFSAKALSGEGARLYGGRWNRQGLPAVYTASSRSLAVLEMLVNDPMILANYAMVAISIPTNLTILSFSAEALQQKIEPSDWRNPFSQDLQPLGNAWLRSGESAVLQVPSLVIPEENNVILNPLHPDFVAITIFECAALNIDARLLQAFQSR